MAEQLVFPGHIAIIMDGNGRWAEAKGLPRILGHREGAEVVRRIVEDCCDLGVRYLTLYAFSWENWGRPADEVQDLMSLLEEFIKRETPTLLERSVRLQVIGRISHLPQRTQDCLRQTIKLTAPGKGMVMSLALSYGGRQEIVDAARKIAAKAAAGEIDCEAIDEQYFACHLYTAGMPDPDLLIRTSGEQRLSNFLLWQLSYSELYMTPKYWPDFSKTDLVQAIEEFRRRDRRYGGRSELLDGRPQADGLPQRNLR